MQSQLLQQQLLQSQLLQSQVMQSQGVKLFVGNLPVTTTDQDLRAMFSVFGTILEVALLKPNSMGVRGAFVRFAEQKSAEDAIANLANYMLPDSRSPLVVRYADTDKPSQRIATLPAFGVAPNLLAPAVEVPKLFVGNVPMSCSKESMEALFKQYGSIQDLALLPVNSTGVRGCIVRYFTKLDMLTTKLRSQPLPSY
jgi:CUG-BP- and ETR3-like factor